MTSSGVALKPSFKPSAANPKILEADLPDPAGQLQSDEERAFWATRGEGEEQVAADPEAPCKSAWGSPPAKWNTLHVDGVRQVRARFPNGNPQDNSGRCFR